MHCWSASGFATAAAIRAAAAVGSGRVAPIPAVERDGDGHRSGDDDRSVAAMTGERDDADDRSQPDDPPEVPPHGPVGEHRRRPVHRRGGRQRHEPVPSAPTDRVELDPGDADGDDRHHRGQTETNPTPEGHPEGDAAGAEDDRGGNIGDAVGTDRAVQVGAVGNDGEAEDDEEAAEDGHRQRRRAQEARRPGRRNGRAGIEQLVGTVAGRPGHGPVHGENHHADHGEGEPRRQLELAVPGAGVLANPHEPEQGQQEHAEPDADTEPRAPRQLPRLHPTKCPGHRGGRRHASRGHRR